jgi:iron-sulfur cluster repair protein YtfE (RIC family)
MTQQKNRRAYIAIHRDVYRKLLGLAHEIESRKGRRVSFGELIDFLIDFYHEHKNETR